MNGHSDCNRLREEQIETYGRLMAGLSHDMKNHLGIIRESAGLIDDMLAANAQHIETALVDKIISTVEKIDKRVVRAGEMLHYLSSFAHRADTPFSSFLLCDILREEVVFLERFARLRQIELQLESYSTASVISSPTLLQHLAYKLSMLCLEQLHKGDTLILSDQDTKISFSAIDTPLFLNNYIEEEYQTALAIVKGSVFIEENTIILAIQAYTQSL